MEEERKAADLKKAMKEKLAKKLDDDTSKTAEPAEGSIEQREAE